MGAQARSKFLTEVKGQRLHGSLDYDFTIFVFSFSIRLFQFFYKDYENNGPGVTPAHHFTTAFWNTLWFLCSAHSRVRPFAVA